MADPKLLQTRGANIVRVMHTESGFTAAVVLVFGIFAWLQFPALCGFMFSSTRMGADNFRYSLWLGGLLALIGLGSGLHALIRGPRGAMLILGAVLNLSFIGAAVAATGWFGASCHALYIEVGNQ
jgi:hypothetical protein